MSRSLENRTALVTGGASGLGAAAARALAEEGAHVIVTDIDEDGAARTAAAITGAGGSASFRGLDVTDEAAWGALEGTLIEAMDGLHAVVLAAGIGHGGLISETTLADWRRVTAVNLDGSMLGVRLAIRVMSAKGCAGSVVLTASTAGLRGGFGLSAYCASKGGVRLLAKSAAVECGLRKLPIRVNCICPGPIDTPMLDQMRNNFFLPEPEVTRILLGAIPQGRFGRPEEYGALAAYLASDACPFLTGADLFLDGGLTAM